MTSQIVRSVMTTTQQHRLTERVISASKLKEIKTIREGQTRKLTIKGFQNYQQYLCMHLESTLSERTEEYVEAHPRLTTGTLYRAVNKTMSMKAARKLYLSLVPSSFKIIITEYLL